MHEARCNNYFIVKYLLKSNAASVILGKKVVFFPQIDRVKFFLPLTRPHSQCVSEYIFLIQKQTKKIIARRQKEKETKEGKEYLWKI